MKKVIFLLTILFIFIMPIKADLTKTQEEDLALFATNFIVEGNKRTDKNGLPLLTYMQGQARIDGYQSKLYKVGYDYKHINLVNEYKWTFDCASFASFVYYHTFGLVLTYNRLSSVDPYSGLTLRNPNANPYQVSAFVEDADKGEHFYYVKRGVTAAKLNYNELKKGDLVIYVGHHIMVYVGDGKIAEATTSAINKTNLGLQVVPLMNNYSNISLSIIRLKDKVISPTAVANTKIRWIDNGETMELVSHAPKTEEYPQIKYDKPSTNWVKNLDVEFKITSTNGLKSYSFSDGNDKWHDISGKSYSLKETITKNGTYVLKVKDIKGLEKQEKITISSIDDIKPIITSLSVVKNDAYSTIEIKAVDEESGLADKPYSFDNGLTWTTKNTYDVTIEKEYIVLVKDKADNTFSNTIVAKISTKAKPQIGNVIMGELDENKRKVTIVVLNYENSKIIVKKDSSSPNDSDPWTDLGANTYITYLDAGSYNVWIKADNGELTTKSFKIEINNSSKKTTSILMVVIPVIIIIIGIFLITKRKNNNI